VAWGSILFFQQIKYSIFGLFKTPGPLFLAGVVPLQIGEPIKPGPKGPRFPSFPNDFIFPREPTKISLHLGLGRLCWLLLRLPWGFPLKGRGFVGPSNEFGGEFEKPPFLEGVCSKNKFFTRLGVFKILWGK